MKTITTITAFILTITFICQDVFAQIIEPTNIRNSSLTNSIPQGTSMPIYHNNTITIKLKGGVGDFGKQSGTVSFGIQSLDEKVSRLEVYSLEKRFRYNPNKLREDLPDLSCIYKITFPEEKSAAAVARVFSEDPNVEYAEPIPINIVNDIPNDAMYSQCQHLPQIWAEEAWNIHKGEDGTEEIIIAIIDTGIDWDHEDLQSNVWQNMAEDADGDGKTMEFQAGEWVLDPGDLNGIDDDNNGYTDDLIGWNLAQNTNDPNPAPANPIEDHGTICAGISNGATNNGTGIASISWNLSLMAICADAVGSIAFGYDGIIYAAENGADIISNSWGSQAYSQANQEVVTYAQQLGSIIVAAAGNANAMISLFPADYSGVISVASVSVDDTKADYSSFSPGVDISAPGGGSEGGILSTILDDDYGLASGTSMSGPLVAGCFGLLKSYHPEWTNEQLITQILVTADTIDYLNPGYEYLLGTGRVNAFRFLDEDPVTMPQILKLNLVSMSYEDANGNQANEPGEEVILNVEFRNYIPYVGDDDVTVILSTDDPEISILSGSATIAIPPDGLFTIEDQFQFQVSDEATPHMAVFTVNFESELEIVWGQEQTVEILVAPGGVFIFEGVENGSGYSGTYIKEVLDQLGIHNIYSNTYPPTLLGFETVFVSHGNLGQDQGQGTIISEGQSLMFQEFLESGGNMYVDMGSMFGFIDYGSYSNAAEIKTLFGVQSNTLNLVGNPIDSLYGMPGSLMEDIHFTQSDQPHSYYVDDLEITSNGVATFTESDYGIVSVMNDGASTYGHKTFYTAYSLAELVDIDPINSRNNVLLKVLDFFELLPEGYLLAGIMANKHDGPMSMEVQFTDASISDPDIPTQSWEWDFNDDGIIDSDQQNPSWIFNNPGKQDVTLIITNDLMSDTLTEHGFITVNHGYLVYEGEPDGEGYSGTFIRDYMEENAFYSVTYRNEIPENLEGYHAVFLSFGNSPGNTYLEDYMADIIIDYLEGGGFVYLEGGGSFNHQKYNEVFLELFGLESSIYPAFNPINFLEGQADAITADMVFTSTSQQSINWVGRYTPNESGIIAFEESDFGIVAVQNTGEYNQRTFCFSYTLADLYDGEEPSTRDELLERICVFFDIYTGEEEPMFFATLKNHVKVYPNPAKDHLVLEFDSSLKSAISTEVFDIWGQSVVSRTSRSEAIVTLDVGHLSPGTYFYKVSAGTLLQTGKFVIAR